MLNEQGTKQSINGWSETIAGLSGRLRVELEDLGPGIRYAIFLELKNQLLKPVAVINQPGVHAELFDSAGKAVDTSEFPVSGPVHPSQWAIIPGEAYIGFRIDMQQMGVPGIENTLALLAVGGKSWGIRPGRYALKATVVFKNVEAATPNQWMGELSLPRVEIVLASQMLAPGHLETIN